MNLTFPVPVQMQVVVFLAALIRFGGIFLTAPFYSGLSVPVQVKIGLVFFLTACVAPLMGDQGPVVLARTASPLTLAILVLGELSVGFTIGMAGAVVVGAIQTAGNLVAQDIGLTIANVIDPITSIQTTVVGQMMVALALFIFVGLDFHHGVIRLLTESFRILPLGTAGDALLGSGERLGRVALVQGSWLFDVSVRLSLPVSVGLLLVTIAMGFLARAVPEMNVFIIGFGLRIFVGMWVIILSLPFLATAFQSLFEKAARESAVALRALAGS